MIFPLLLLAQAAAATADDIHDIRGLILLPSPWAGLRWVIVTLVLLGLLWTAWEAWQRQRRKIIPLDLIETTLAELEKTRPLLHRETTREFSIALSQIIRTYIEKQFSAAEIHAADRTTEEFLHHLANQNNSPLTPHRALLEEFLRYCDMAKFGRWNLSIIEMEAMLQSARTFILDTRPQAPAAAPATTPAPPASRP